MTKLERLNVVKIVATEYDKDRLLAKGFKLVREPEKKVKDAEKKAAK